MVHSNTTTLETLKLISFKQFWLTAKSIDFSSDIFFFFVSKSALLLTQSENETVVNNIFFEFEYDEMETQSFVSLSSPFVVMIYVTSRETCCCFPFQVKV